MLKQLYRFLSPKFQNVFLEYPVAVQPRYGHGKPSHSGLQAIVEQHRAQYEFLANRVLDFVGQLQTIPPCSGQNTAGEPCWNNGFLPGLDIAMLYTMLAHFRPERYVEIGSGNSTKVARRCISEQGLTTQITSIDPAPRAEIDALADEVVRAPFETTSSEIFRNLEAGDIVFVDNSHRVLPNSDATAFFLEVLPLLPDGVIVQLHDIYLPDDYPPFMCERFYSEQYVLAAFLLAGQKRYVPLFPAWWVSGDSSLSAILSPLWDHPNLEGVERHGGSFWLKITH